MSERPEGGRRSRRPPADERESDGENRGRQREHDERGGHPEQTASDESPGTEPVREHATRECAEAEQPVADGDDDADGRPVDLERLQPQRDEDGDGEFVGVDHRVREGDEADDGAVVPVHCNRPYHPRGAL